MIKSVTQLIAAIQADVSKWGNITKPWFRGESGDQLPLCPKIAKYTASEENYLLQSFRRQAGGLTNTPPRDQTDMWLFFAQHYGVPTRLLDWTEGALHALYFAINGRRSNPRIYMLNAQRLNELAGLLTDAPNYPLSWVKAGAIYIALAWQHRNIDNEQINQIRSHGWNPDIPIAFPATYQDQRMIAQRSCFTIHGLELKPLTEILKKNKFDVSECVIEYQIDFDSTELLLRELSILGISAATIFPDLDHLSQDLIRDISIK